tara:strand:- start:187 stop:675 length:489 start_codon:yes stop_codon:yes gene_type:complete
MISVVQPVLHQNGLILIQPPTTTCDGVSIILTRLIHVETGQEITSELVPFLPENMGNKPMFTWGGSLTYGRRYAIKMLLGIEPDQDTNTEDPKELEKEQKRNKPQSKPIKNFVRECEAYIKKTSDPDRLKVLKTNISKRYKEKEITEKDRDYLLSLILEKDE